MLRNLALALLGVTVLAGPAAARRDDTSGGRRAEWQKASAKVEQRPLLRRVAFTRPAAPVCARTGRGATLRCRGGASQTASWRWAQGLPPALNVQAQECPADTMATLAEGHDDIVRCIPI